MKTVLKYPFPNSRMAYLHLHVGAEILSVQEQGEDLCLWALVDAKALNEDFQKEVRTFRVYETGQQIDDVGQRLKFIATIQEQIFVWHIFEVLP